MEEDIELVEEFINICEINFKFYEQPNVVIISDTVEAIKNLIKRNKELEKLELEHQRINGNLREKIKELEHKYQRALSDLVIAENTKHTCPYIPTSGVTCKAKEFEAKIKEKIDKYKKSSNEYYEKFLKTNKTDTEIRDVGICCDAKVNVLQELLEE